MSSNFLHQKYQELWQQLQYLAQSLAEEKAQGENLDLLFLPLVNLMEQQILNLDQESLELSLSSKWQQLQTEINRSYRLLKTDLLFFKSARQPHLKSQRLITVQQRLSQIMSYVQGILALLIAK
jgi:hypothetical protein